MASAADIPSLIEQSRKFNEAGEYEKAIETAEKAAYIDDDSLEAWTACMSICRNVAKFRTYAGNVCRLTSDAELKSKLQDTLENYRYLFLPKVFDARPGSVDRVENKWADGVWVKRGIHMTSVLGHYEFWNISEDCIFEYMTKAYNNVPDTAYNFIKLPLTDQLMEHPLFEHLDDRLECVKLYLDPLVLDNLDKLLINGELEIGDADEVKQRGYLDMFIGLHTIDYDPENPDRAMRTRTRATLTKDSDLRAERTIVKIKTGFMKHEKREGLELKVVPHNP